MANALNADATIRQRRLAERLKQLRGDRTATDVADATGITKSKISRIESCYVRAQPQDVETLARAYGVDDEQREKLVQQAHEAYNSTVMRDYIGYEWASALQSHLELEADASRIDSFTIDLVPGLLQTREYTRALIAKRPDVDQETIERRLDFRALRQRRVTSQDLQLWAVINETVLYQQIGGRATLADQLEALADSPPNVTIQVQPFTSGAHPSLGTSFHLFQFPESPKLVYQDTIRRGIYQDDAETVRNHEHIMEHTQASARSPHDSISWLRDRAAELRA